MSENATLELALRQAPEAVMLTPPQIQVIANTEFVPKSMRGNVPKVLACIARGRAMGIPDMVAVNGIDIIEGKATLSAELMVAIVREHGHSITGDVTADRAVVRGKRADNGDTMTAEFNREMAEAAGLLQKSNYKKHPDDMMWARAVSKLCRRLFADCFAGGTYSREDLLSDDDVTADETHDEVGRPDPVAEIEQDIKEAEWAAGSAGERENGPARAPSMAAPGTSASDDPTAVAAAGQTVTAPRSPADSPLDKFVALCKDANLDGALVNQVRRELFPNRPASSLTEDELADLFSEVQERSAQESLPVG